jgi:hypothetical protein
VAITLKWLLDHARNEGVVIRPVPAPAPTPSDKARQDTSMRTTGPIIFKKHVQRTGDEQAAAEAMNDSLTGTSGRVVLEPARTSTTDTIHANDRIIGYRRQTRDKPCAFCAMLASRGAVYKSELTGEIVGASGRVRGSREVGQSYHDNCGCVAVPVYSRDSTPPPFAEQWAEAKRLARDQGLRVDIAFRQIIEGRAKILAPV